MTNDAIAPLLVASISTFLGYYLAIIIVRLLLTWFPNIDWMQQTVGFLSPITDPYLNLFRFVPPIGSIDLSPIIAIIVLQSVMGALNVLR
jgi:YggT family protein